MKIAIYARYSSNHQKEASIDDQIHLCERHLQQLGYSQSTPFTDYAMSGASLDRPGIQSLLRACQDGKFDLVIAEALDRISRDQEDIAGVYKRLTFAGVKLITVSEGEISELHVGLKGTMNSLFLKDLADKTRRGLRGRIEAGKSAGGKSFGYDVVTKFTAGGEPIRGDQAINQPESRLVNRIFEEYAAGRSPRAIARSLNAEAIPGPRGNGWGPSTINGNRTRGTGILNNELYIGRRVWNRLRYLKDPETGKRVSRLNDEANWVIKPVPELRIIPQDLWDRVKTRQESLTLKRTPSDPHPYWQARRPRHLFSGLIKCGQCGGGYSKINNTLFGCSTARNKGTCDNRLTISKVLLEHMVLHGLRNNLMDPDLFKIYCEEFTREANTLHRKQSGKKAAQKQQLTKTEAEIAKLIDALKAGVSPASVKDELSTLEQRKETLTRSLTELPPERPLVHPNMGDLYRAKIARLQGLLESNEKNYEAFDLIRSLVNEITLMPVNGELKLDLKGDLASILNLFRGPKPSQKLSEQSIEQLKMVAGVGFEPTTFRL